MAPRSAEHQPPSGNRTLLRLHEFTAKIAQRQKHGIGSESQPLLLGNLESYKDCTMISESGHYL
jgi:hypothetical protein